MTSSPVVDIIVSTNRTSPFLRPALDSVRAQTWPHWRLIVVGDGISDPAWLEDEVQRVPDAKVIHQKASGLPAARNTGIRAGGGELIAFLDDDDVWHPEKLERQVSAWLDAPQHVGVYSGGWFMDSKGRRFGDDWEVRQTSSLRFLSGAVPLPRIVTLLVVRRVAEALGGFNESFSLAEDHEFITRLVTKGEMLAVPTALTGYRRHETNMTNAPGIEALRATDRFLETLIEDAAQRGEAELAQLLRGHRRRFWNGGSHQAVAGVAQAVRQRDWHGAWQEARWALAHSPWWAARSAAERGWSRLRGGPDH